jgi:hypothetical protein
MGGINREKGVLKNNKEEKKHFFLLNHLKKRGLEKFTEKQT